MSDSDDHRDVESDTAVKTAKRRGRGRKRTPSKVVSKSKKLKQNETSEDLLAKDEVPVQEMPPCSVAQPTFTMPQLPQTVTQPPQPAPQQAHTIPQHTQAVPQPLQTVPPSPHIVPQHSHANFQPPHMVPDYPHTVPLHPHAVPQLPLSLPQPRQAGPQPSYTGPPHVHAVPQPQLPHAVPQPQHAMPQNPQAGLQPPHTVPHHPYTIPQPPHVVHQPPHSGPQPSNTVPQHPQAAPPSSVPGSIEGVSLPTFFQFTMPSNVYPSPVLNSTLQTPLQQAVPSSLTTPHSSTMSLLSALQDDKLALILPVLVRMEHKIDQIMAMMGAKSSTGVNGLQVGNQLNATPVGNQSSATVIESQSSATSVESLQSNVPLRNQSNATTSVRNQSNTTTSVRNQSNARAVKNQSSVTATRNRLTETVVRNQLNFATTETQKNATTRNQSTANTASTNQSNTGTTATLLNTPDTSEPATSDSEPASHPAEMETQSSVASAETHLTDTTVENGEKADTVMEYQLSGLTPLLSGSFDASKSLPGISARQRMQLEMAKITEQTLPDDLNFPISRDNLIALQARSNSTMNFAVRLLRELFTPDELFGRNISGVRGKDQVDPRRVEMIKEILFKIYRTSPADKELLWRYCRKAMDSFLRKMQRPGVGEEQN